IADDAEDEAADGAADESHGEAGEAVQLLRGGARFGKERLADRADEESVGREVEPLEDVADDARERGARRGLAHRRRRSRLRGGEGKREGDERRHASARQQSAYQGSHRGGRWRSGICAVAARPRRSKRSVHWWTRCAKGPWRDGR